MVLLVSNFSFLPNYSVLTKCIVITKNRHNEVLFSTSFRQHLDVTLGALCCCSIRIEKLAPLAL